MRCGIAVGGARAGEDDAIDADGPHRGEQRERADDVVVIVDGRVLDRDADIGEGGEVHHGFGFVVLHRGDESLGFEQAGRDERQVADGRAMAFGEVVDDEDVVAAFGELFGGV